MDSEVLINFGLMSVEKLTELYGEVFSKLVRQAVADFISKKVGEQAPRLETMEDTAGYVRNNLQKYPMGHCAFWYGIGKAETQIQGSAGPAIRVMLGTILRRMTELDGLSEIIGKTDKTINALSDFKKVAVSMEMLDENSYQCTGDADASEARIVNCPNGDGCRSMLEEGVMRIGTRKPLCTISLGSAVTAELVTKVPHDYEITELKPPNCVARIFKL
ncbi:MAG: hypothetical protein WED05_08175 [Candidatus Atabeyarchaeum deiterrae]